MSEIMRPLSFAQLMGWALKEYKQQGSVFGLPKNSFYHYGADDNVEICGEKLASPLGVAAGPHTQMAQNLVVCYLAGARYLELKTIQQLDGAELSAYIVRPCIRAEDEGYNVEWSTELTVEQATKEYIHAWLAIHALAKEFKVAKERDFAFNISVGYDLPGIQSAKVNNFIETMKDASASPAFAEGIAWLKENIGLFEHLNHGDIEGISPCIAKAVTLSTLHGCPADEIESIAAYLLTEKGLHTYVKCNPTLLGYSQTRLLLDDMGFDYISFDDHHFKQDLQYQEALMMLRRLRRLAIQRNLVFGVKLTNTLPVQVERMELDGEEMYLSGRALYPLTVNIAAMLARDFDGQLPLSYCGGADAFNIGPLAKAGLQPITVTTTLLKPGGYERLSQLAELVAAELRNARLSPPEPEDEDEDEDEEDSLLASILAKTRGAKTPGLAINSSALKNLAENVVSQKRYRKEQRPVASRKVGSMLPLFDCFISPCNQGGCPFGQQIPLYLSQLAAGDKEAAFKTIVIDNPLPAITGVICNHPCQNVCTRLDYDDALSIREAKRLASEGAQQAFTAKISPAALKNPARVAIVGAGPAGIAAAVFLRRNGLAVTVLEKREKPLGMAEYLIPEFRLAAPALAADFAMAKAIGVEFCFGMEVRDLAALRKDYDYVLLCVGAWRKSAPVVQEGQELIIDALDFLERAKKQDTQLQISGRVAVLGGGDVAMDCARVALRAPGVQQVSIVYRRTREFMPAQPEEINQAVAEGVKIVELASPVSYDGSSLLCERMRVGAWEVSGRRAVMGTGGKMPLHFDTVICATGARVDSDLWQTLGLATDAKGLARVNEALESSVENVYVAGDAKAGPATVAKAIADAKLIAVDILAKLGLEHDFANLPAKAGSQPAKRGILAEISCDKEEAARCLHCGAVCGICAEVCPNRANITLVIPDFTQAAQIVHVDALCNECGNCAVFCPHQGAPYQDKFTLFATAEDFADTLNPGWLKLAENLYRLRLADGEVRETALADMPEEMARIIETVEREYYYLLP